MAGVGLGWPSGQPISFEYAWELADSNNECAVDSVPRYVVIVLRLGLCQRCRP